MNARIFVCASVFVCLAATGCASAVENIPHAHVGFAATSGVVRAAPQVAVREGAIFSGDWALWSLPADGPIDAPRVFDVADAHVVVVRQGDGIFVGSFDTRELRTSPLVRVSGRRHWVGAPCARVVDDALVVAWREGGASKKAAWRAGAIDASVTADACSGEQP